MLSFLRKIRRLSIESGRARTYMFYALGEIVLVVIGILIALQINNWNEIEKKKFTDHNYLKDMLEDFETNNEVSQEVIFRIEELLPTLIGLLEQSALEKPTILVDSINFAFSRIIAMPAYSSTDRVYNNLIGSGDLKIIGDGELKTLLSEYYESLYILNLVQSTHELELVQSFEPYILENLDLQAISSNWIEDLEIPPPVEESKILEVFKDRKFRNIITLKLNILADLLNQNRNLKEINVDMIERLKFVIPVNK